MEMNQKEQQLEAVKEQYQPFHGNMEKVYYDSSS